MLRIKKNNFLTYQKKRSDDKSNNNKTKKLFTLTANEVNVHR